MLAAKAPSQPKAKIKPPVPAKDDVPVMGLVSNKNFIATNALETILSSPKKVPRDEMLYTQRPGFGKVRAWQVVQVSGHVVPAPAS